MHVGFQLARGAVGRKPRDGGFHLIEEKFHHLGKTVLADLTLQFVYS